MAKICPHCKYDPTARKFVEGGATGLGLTAVTLFNPVLGAAALTGLALKAWIDSGKTEIKCPKCNKYYHT